MSTYSGFGAGAFGAVGGSITFEWVPSPEVESQLFMSIAGKLDETSVPIALSREAARRDVREHFDTESAPDGSKWAPWARDYPDSEQILVKSGALRDAATSDAAFPVTTDSLFFEFGALPFYGMFHQYGANRGGSSVNEAEVTAFVHHMHSIGAETYTHAQARSELAKEGGSGGNLPARPFAGLSESAELDIVEIFDLWFQGAIGVGYRDPTTGRFTKSTTMGARPFIRSTK